MRVTKILKESVNSVVNTNFITKQDKASNASSDDDSSSEEGADDVDNESVDTSSSQSDKVLKGKNISRDESDTSKDNDSSKVIIETSSDTDDDTCEDLDDKESVDKLQVGKGDSSMEELDEKDGTVASSVPLTNTKTSLNEKSNEVLQSSLNGVAQNSSSVHAPKLMFSSVVEVKDENNHVQGNHVNTRFSIPNATDTNTRPVIDVDEARQRAEKVVAAVFAEAKEVAEAAARADAKGKSKETNSDSEESRNNSSAREETDNERLCVDNTKHRKYSVSEDSSEDSSETYSPSSTSNDDRSRRTEIIANISENKNPTIEKLIAHGTSYCLM